MRPSSPARRARSCRASAVSDGLNATCPEGEGSGFGFCAAGTARGGVGGPPGFSQQADRVAGMISEQADEVAGEISEHADAAAEASEHPP